MLFEAAYFAEIMRAGIQSDEEADRFRLHTDLGYPMLRPCGYVVLPQAIRHMLPVLLTQTIILFQDTSLVYVISGNDFMGSISKIAQRDGQLVLMYSFAAVCYLAVSLSLSLLIRRLQARMRNGSGSSKKFEAGYPPIMAMIEIKNISKWYGNFQVLKDCSVDR